MPPMSDTPPDPRPKSKIMWAVMHVPSGAWDSGDGNFTVYWAKHAARRDCPNAAFVPVKVVVTIAKDQSDE